MVDFAFQLQKAMYMDLVVVNVTDLSNKVSM
jgi:hypothetical protein